MCRHLFTTLIMGFYARLQIKQAVSYGALSSIVYTYTNTEMTENLREILTFLIFYRCVC